MKKNLACVVSFILLLCIFVPCAFAAEYADTENHWAETAIERWTDTKVISGDGDGNFRPDDFITRAEAAQLFCNLLKLKDTADLSAYTDIDPNAWYIPALSACVANGIILGTGDGLLDPNGLVTREMMFTMLARVLHVEPESTLMVGVYDSETISDWAAGYVNALINHGYISGVAVQDGKPVVCADSSITRASVVQLLHKTIVFYVNTSGSASYASSTENGWILVAADNVSLTDVPAGTRIIVAKDTVGLTVNGVSLVGNDSANGTFTPYAVPEVTKPEPSTPSGPSMPSGPSKTYSYNVKLNVKAGDTSVTYPSDYTSKSVATPVALAKALVTENSAVITNNVNLALSKFNAQMTDNEAEQMYALITEKSQNWEEKVLAVATELDFSLSAEQEKVFKDLAACGSPALYLSVEDGAFVFAMSESEMLSYVNALENLRKTMTEDEYTKVLNTLIEKLDVKIDGEENIVNALVQNKVINSFTVTADFEFTNELAEKLFSRLENELEPKQYGKIVGVLSKGIGKKVTVTLTVTATVS